MQNIRIKSELGSGKQQRERADMFRENVPFISIVLVILLFWLINGNRFLSGRNWSFIAQQLPILLLLAFAQLIVVTSGSIDISVGSSLGFSAFAGAMGMTHFGSSGLLLGVLAGAFVGMINGLIISIVKIPSFVATLAMQIILRASLILLSSGKAIYIVANRSSDVRAVVAPWLLGLGQFPSIFIISAVVAALMWVFYSKTAFGQQLKALGGNEKVLRLAGISVNTFKVQVFVAAGIIVGLAAVINLARAGAATPQAGTMLELDSIAAVALGGTVLTGGYGSVPKTVLGALTLIVVSNGLTIAGVPPSWSEVARGLLLITAIAISLDRKKIETVK